MGNLLRRFGEVWEFANDLAAPESSRKLQGYPSSSPGTRINGRKSYGGREDRE